MTSAAAIVADLRRSIEWLAERDDPAMTRVAAILRRCLAGEDFEMAADLPPGWRRQLQQQSRGAALCALLRLYAGLTDSDVARRIYAGVARAGRKHGDRPDGEAGYFFDLMRLDERLSGRRWRALITEHLGHCNACVSQQSVVPSASQENN